MVLIRDAEVREAEPLVAVDEQNVREARGFPVIAGIGEVDQPQLVAQSLILAKSNIPRLQPWLRHLADGDHRVRRQNFEIAAGRLHERAPPTFKRPLPTLDKPFKA